MIAWVLFRKVLLQERVGLFAHFRREAVPAFGMDRLQVICRAVKPVDLFRGRKGFAGAVDEERIVAQRGVGKERPGASAAITSCQSNGTRSARHAYFLLIKGM